MKATFAKTLSANDVGATGSHQAGILVPKADKELMAFFPVLDPAILNPDAWIICIDEFGDEWKFRYVYYNNRLHAEHGTRNEYRLTYLTKFFKRMGAKAGDSLLFSTTNEVGKYRISLKRKELPAEDSPPGVIVLQGWRRVH
ncbi:EcoRII N-terminal effector-binding domain-containing protein [Lysobacter auxotrophicus]|uniref:Restriction endonuclease n=1 Tax=Lysobacter auxotrophicus TaxID=2992573 RepID=A0ABN6UNZ3_9GAMM|nr:EcoRII N-terminal effector-binding domain-containing protein [Lysobacter auxotrophicus]BDU18086.1 restriction endonuclease [Lysobacter auxotrophicus]